MEDLKFQTAESVTKWSNNTGTDTSFQSNNNCGFQMAINGFRISVVFGPGSYISDTNIRYNMELDEPMSFKHFGTDTAEILVWNRNGEPIIWDNRDEVIGFCSSDTIAKVIGCLASCGNEDPTRALQQICDAQG
tara:strand:+ start:143 stop:544 length:402 start_codon:yes stop_codon:yes gene_type:complete